MRSIQSLIFIRLFAIIVIFFLVVSSSAYFLTAEAIKQFAVSDASTSLSFIVNNIETNYKSELKAIDQIASLHGFVPFEENTARSIIKDFLELPNIFTTVHLYRADGELVIAERRSSLGNGKPYKPRPNFNLKEPEFIALARKVIDEKHPVSSDTFFTWQGILYQTYITPVFTDRSKEHVFGILSGGVFPRLHKIEKLLQGLKLGKDNFILITDSAGHFITGDGITEDEAESSIKEHTEHATKFFFGDHVAPVAPGTAPGVIPGTAPAATSSGMPAPPVNNAKQVFVDQRVAKGELSFIVVSLPIPELRLIVTLGSSTSPIDQKTRELSSRLTFALVIGLLFSLFASIFVGERLAKPFREVAHTVNEINIGNFSARTRYSGNDEIGHLSQRINVLAEKIQKSEYLGSLWSNEAELDEERNPTKRKSAPSPEESGELGAADSEQARSGDLEQVEPVDLGENNSKSNESGSDS